MVMVFMFTQNDRTTFIMFVLVVSCVMFPWYHFAGLWIVVVVVLMMVFLL